MSFSAQAQNREKFNHLLKLSSAQITALESDDMAELDRILDEKREVIAALSQARAMIDADPSLAKLADRINASEQTAQRLLFTKAGKMRREMNDQRQRAKVRAAYASSAPLSPRMRLMSAPDTPRFVDQKS